MRNLWGWRGGGGESKTYLFDSSKSKATAVYQAANAVSKLNKLAALIIDMFGPPLASRCKYPIPSNRNTRSREKKMKKNARFERSVATTTKVVNINQPWICVLSQQRRIRTEPWMNLKGKKEDEGWHTKKKKAKES